MTNACSGALFSWGRRSKLSTGRAARSVHPTFHARTNSAYVERLVAQENRGLHAQRLVKQLAVSQSQPAPHAAREPLIVCGNYERNAQFFVQAMKE